MFALLAAMCFFLTAIGVHAPVSLVWLGAALFALQFAFPVGIPWPRKNP